MKAGPLRSKTRRGGWSAGLRFWLAMAALTSLAQADAPQPAPRFAHTNRPPVVMRPNTRTNLAGARPPGAPRAPNTPATPPNRADKNAAAVHSAGAQTNAAGRLGQSASGARAGLIEKLRTFRQSRFFYPVLAGACLCLGLGALLVDKLTKAKARSAEPATGHDTSLALRLAKSRKRKVTISSCNVVQFGPEGRRLWQFDARSSGFVLNKEQTTSQTEPFPSGINKDWRALWQHKLNVAWLPPEHVFLRVTHLPQSEFAEMLSMVELQLEKLSPMPVGQILWSVQVLPGSKSDLQTVVVMIVARSVVEEFLGKLEGQGYLADRLEIPLLDQLDATHAAQAPEDGAWIYPESEPGKSGALVAWWSGGTLQNLGLTHLPAGNRAAGLKEQLWQMAWAAEMEGWFHGTPRWRLVADEKTAQQWEPPLREGLGEPIEVIPPLPAPRLAALTAARAAVAEPAANLLPEEFATRYQQQFVDRLWMRGLGTVLGVYLLYVLIFFGRLELALNTEHGVEQQVALLGPTYTNALQMKARYLVLRDRQDLKYAALDCWKAVAETMPAELTLDGCNFSEGQKLVLNGTAPTEAVSAINEFESKMRKVMLGDQLLFDPVRGEHFTYHQNPGGKEVSWNFSLELKRAED